MNRSTELDFDQRIADWLEDDPNHAPRVAMDTVLAAYPSIPQRRAWRAPWRYITVTTPMRLAAAVILGLLAIGGALYVGVGGKAPARTHPASESGRWLDRDRIHARTTTDVQRDAPGRWPRARRGRPW